MRILMGKIVLVITTAAIALIMFSAGCVEKETTIGTELPTPAPTSTPEQVVSTSISNLTPTTNNDGQLYYSLLKKAKAFDKSVDFKALRLSYTETSDYNPYNETDNEQEAMFDAMRDKQYDKALKHAQSILNTNYVDIGAHIVSQTVYQEMNNSEQYNFHQFVVDGLIKSILNSGDGKSPETAYLVIDIKEEIFFLEILGFEMEGLTLLEKNNHFYHKIEVKKPETGETAVLYFNVDIPSNWLNKHIKREIIATKPAPKVEGIALPVEEWNKTFGRAGFDTAHSVQQTSDGGYILAGETIQYGAGKGDIWLIKTDASGNQQWNKTFGGTEEDMASSVHQTTDGSYILAGITESYVAGGYDAWLIKTDAKGNLQWSKTLGETGYDSVGTVQQTSDGGYILFGGTESYG